MMKEPPWKGRWDIGVAATLSISGIPTTPSSASVWRTDRPLLSWTVVSHLIVFSKKTLLLLLFFLPAQNGGEMSELDDAGTYFDLGPRKITSRGMYHYMCSRNNNFTNRSQKGKIVVTQDASRTSRIGWNGGMARVSK